MVREDGSEEIIKNVEGNLEEDTRSDASEPVYDHRMRIKERSRPLWKCNDNQPISVFWEIGGTKAHYLIDSGCKGMMISPNFIRAAKIEPLPLDKPIGIQLAATGSKSVINYGTNMTIKCKGKNQKNISISST